MTQQTIIIRNAVEAGLPLLSLDVFTGNGRAREFYTELGHREEMLRLLKPVGADPGAV